MYVIKSAGVWGTTLHTVPWISVDASAIKRGYDVEWECVQDGLSQTCGLRTNSE